MMLINDDDDDDVDDDSNCVIKKCTPFLNKSTKLFTLISCLKYI